jgi:pimeloyl-ACP methyl ester carboxylesterase
MASTTKVFVHGNPEVDAIWSDLVTELAGRGHDDVVLLSPPGFGAPTPDGWPADVAAYRSWLIGELERLVAGGATVDLVGHDWGAGHVFGAVVERPDLVRSFAADCFGLIHPDYVWHDMAQVWQTPGAGEDLVEAMMGGSVADRSALFEGLGIGADAAAAMAAAGSPEMGRCILALYRDAAQPAASAIGDRLAEAQRPPALAIIATADPYVGAGLSVDMATRLGADVLTLDGRGHWWMCEDPARAADGLSAFWSK